MPEPTDPSCRRVDGRWPTLCLHPSHLWSTRLLGWCCTTSPTSRASLLMEPPIRDPTSAASWWPQSFGFHPWSHVQTESRNQEMEKHLSGLGLVCQNSSSWSQQLLWVRLRQVNRFPLQWEWFLSFLPISSAWSTARLPTGITPPTTNQVS